MWGIMIQQYLDYSIRHPEEQFKPGDIFERFYSFMVDLLGMDEQDAELEVAYFMNTIYDLMD